MSPAAVITHEVFNQNRGLTMGMGMTEKQGGSDTTRRSARPSASA